jgi:acetoin:2,6-dichlorophenolindophenol oxidoreductase subunit alpha|tara:strand:+ start:5382 stop:6353 length:972 start_codon:yes stop_codon:yes gene_type:complete
MHRFQKINKKTLLDAFKKVITIRVIEEKIAQKSRENKIWSFLHLSVGQEACATGVAMGTKPNDLFLGNHRSHAHYLAKNGNEEKMIMEIFGDEGGCCKGYGGSMHMLDKKVNFMGSIPILGSAISIASGMAMAEKLNRTNNIVVVFVGDGAAEEGSFYETINMAGLYKLPLLVVLEDNKYAVESSHDKRKVKNYNFKKIFNEGMQSLYERVDGQDFVKVLQATKSLRKNIIEKNKVGILHADCIRFSKHSGAAISIDDQKSSYRHKNEYLQIRNKDPINILKQYIIEKKYFKVNELDKIKKNKILKISQKFDFIFKKIPVRKI